MGFRKIIRLFDKGNVCVCGLRGTGKDMLISNVIARRKLPYVSNVPYGGNHHPLVLEDFDTHNTYEDFISGNLSHYEFPYPDGTDLYISDAGVYFPSHYCNQLNRDHGEVPTFMALSRHLGDCNVHFNVQNLNRCWDKIREQSDIYIRCNWCKVFFGKLVIQKVTLYELYDSAVRRVPVFRLPRPLINPDRCFQWKIQRNNYEIAHGEIESKFLLYWHRGDYDTRYFKEVLSTC